MGETVRIGKVHKKKQLWYSNIMTDMKSFCKKLEMRRKEKKQGFY